MFETYHTIEMMMKQRERTLLAEAERATPVHRVARRVHQRPLLAPVLAGFGKALLAAGRRLQDRYEPARSAAHCPDCGAPFPS